MYVADGGEPEWCFVQAPPDDIKSWYGKGSLTACLSPLIRR